MAFLLYEQESSTDSVKDIDDLAPPANATGAQLQSDTNHVRYTMDGSTNPTTSSGMLLLTTEAPEEFLIDDLLNIKFIRDGAVNGNLNVHWFAGRDI